MRGTANQTIPLNKDWLFGGPVVKGSTQPEFDDGGFERVAIPHASATFSWQDIDRSNYEYVSIYRRHFSLPLELQNRRIFIDFAGVMAASTVTINGESLGEYKGGYTPCSFELTPHLNWEGDNVLAVEVDSRRSRNIPPFGGTVDFDTFGGIYREVSLRAVPETFIENVFAKPVGVLDDDRRLDVRCFLDSVAEFGSPIVVEAELRDGNQLVAETRAEGTSSDLMVDLSMSEFGQIELWDVDNPKLYEVRVRLCKRQEPVYEYRTRVGFREARFTPDGFYLNGRRLQLFGLNRHEIFPYVGGAMPLRVQRRDAEILKRELKCNMVRTSHYPQSPEFLDACDELGLLVWDEMPGWQHVGDGAWKDVAIENARKMIRRDWNHPSIILWAVRINESKEDWSEFYTGLNNLAHELDDSRQTTGAYSGINYMEGHPLRQDVYGRTWYGDLDELPEPRGELNIFAEAVGQYAYDGSSFRRFYRRIDSGHTQQTQAERHARAHDQVGSDSRYAGLLAWCAFDYNSPHNSFREVKTPGVYDIFRIPKPGAAIYRSQCDPEEEVVLEPAFYWDFGERSPRLGPSESAMICSNCERLEVYVGGEPKAEVDPDRERFSNLRYPPFFVDLAVDGAEELPELRIDGFAGGRKVISRSFSADTGEDWLLVEADDEELDGEGIDATRVVLRAVDKYGTARPFVTGDVRIQIDGPGQIVGDNPFSFTDSGGAGAVWVKTEEGGDGEILLRATHEKLGVGQATIRVRKPTEVPEKLEQ